MAVSNTTVEVALVGVAQDAPVSVNMKLFAENEVKVYYGDDRTLATLGEHYSITLNDVDNYNDFDITFLEALFTIFTGGVTNTVTIRRDMPNTTTIDTNATQSRQRVAQEFDRLWMRHAEISDYAVRGIRLPSGEFGIDLPVAADRAGKFLYFDEDGIPAVYGDTVAELAAVAASINALLALLGEYENGPASMVGVVPFAGMVAEDVQAALEELYAEKAALVHSHDDLYFTEAEVTALFAAEAVARAAAITAATPAAADAISGLSRRATTAEIRGLADVGHITPIALKTAATFVALIDAATIAVDFSTFNNAEVTIDGNRTLGDPGDMTSLVGKAGVLVVTAINATRTLNKHADYLSSNVVWPISIPQNQRAFISYFIYSAALVWITGVQINPT